VGSTLLPTAKKLLLRKEEPLVASERLFCFQ
jgi:hypothetical protein